MSSRTITPAAVSEEAGRAVVLADLAEAEFLVDHAVDLRPVFRLACRLPCFAGGSGVTSEQEVMLVYLCVNDIKIPAALDLGSA